MTKRRGKIGFAAKRYIFAPSRDKSMSCIVAAIQLPWNAIGSANGSFTVASGRAADVVAVEHQQVGALFGETVDRGEDEAVAFGRVGAAGHEQRFLRGGVVEVVELELAVSQSICATPMRG